MSSLKVNEIFYSIQGESSLVGHPTVFVRTTGCHLRCDYCDTQYSYHEGQLMSVDEIIHKIRTYSTRRVCVTGGEPLLQSEVYHLLSRLCEESYEVSLETSGDKSAKKVDERVKVIFDVKTPGHSARKTYKFHPDNLPAQIQHRTVKPEYKFVICNENDFAWTQKFAQDHGLFGAAEVLYSPSHPDISPSWLAEKMLQESSAARLQIQLHKYIWTEPARGV